jgi:serine/threonine protein kinase
MSQPCPACGGAIPAGAAFCPDCGNVLQAAPAPKTAAPGAARAAGPASGTQVRDLRCDVCKSQSRPGSLVCERCSAALPLAGGTVLDGGRERYRLEKHLKSGGFGAVYKATRLTDNATVAVKEMICANPAERAVRYELFQREFRILKDAQQFRVVPEFYDFFDVRQDAYLVLEFVQGEDLLRIMERNGRPYDVDQVVPWAAQICDVLDWMHNQHPPMVHRDLKPENIMLLPGGGIKMIDFGTVRAAGKPPPSGGGGTQTQFIYTEGYAPLEQKAGRAEPRSDLFALSATIFHLLTNQYPDEHNTPPLDQVLPGCPAGWRSWCASTSRKIRGIAISPSLISSRTCCKRRSPPPSPAISARPPIRLALPTAKAAGGD